MIYMCVGLSNVLLTFKGGVSFVDLFCYSCFVSVMLSCLYIAALGHLLGKGSLVFDAFFCYSHFPMCCPVSGLVLDCINF